jgi:cytochrome c nitrite reductase small subunit
MCKKLLSFFYVPDSWKIPFILLLGVFCGIGTYLVYVSNSIAYLSSDPETCMNCHIMAPEFKEWEVSSHRRVTNCIDCHLPQDNFVNQYLKKAEDGSRHMGIFVLNLEPHAIQIHESGKRAVQQNCKRCHMQQIETTHLGWARNSSDNPERPCWDCHRYVPHGRVRSVVSHPVVNVPMLKKASDLFSSDKK